MLAVTKYNQDIILTRLTIHKNRYQCIQDGQRKTLRTVFIATVKYIYLKLIFSALLTYVIKWSEI